MALPASRGPWGGISRKIAHFRLILGGGRERETREGEGSNRSMRLRRADQEAEKTQRDREETEGVGEEDAQSHEGVE